MGNLRYNPTDRDETTPFTTIGSGPTLYGLYLVGKITFKLLFHGPKKLSPFKLEYKGFPQI